MTSWLWETGSILFAFLWCRNHRTRCLHSIFLTNQRPSWGDTHIPRSWEAGYNLFDLRDQLGSASQQLNTGYTRPSHGEYWILTCPCVLTLTARTLEIIAYFVFLITSFVEGGGGSVFWSSSSQWPGFIHISCYCSSLSPSCLALAGRLQSPIPGYYLAPWPLTESVHTNNN